MNSQQDKFRMHATQSMQVALGLEKDQAIINDIRRNPGPFSLLSLMQECVRQMGKDPIGLTANALYNMSIGSSDLPAILENTINKSVSIGYNEAKPTFQAFVKEESASNFNQKKLVKLSNFGDIDDLPEGAPFKNKRVSDKYETIQLSTKGNKATITRQAMLNDDTGSLSSIPRSMGAAVARRQNKDAYDLLTYNSLVGPLMNEDGIAVFNASSHHNLIATSGTPSVISISAAERKLMEMPTLKADPADTDGFMNSQGQYLVTGTANKTVVQQLLNSTNDPNASITGVHNPYAQNAIIPIMDAYLQSKLTAAGKPNAWYLLANQNMLPSLVVCYLSGNKEPVARQEYSAIGCAQGITFEIYSDWDFAFGDYRGIVYNDGADS